MKDRAPAAKSTVAETVLAWLATVLSCAYLYWAYTVLAKHSGTLQNLLESRGGELPSPAAFLLNHHVWLYPAIFGSTALLLVAKELGLHNKRLSLTLTLMIVLITLFVVDSLKMLLFLPLLDMLQNVR